MRTTPYDQRARVPIVEKCPMVGPEKATDTVEVTLHLERPIAERLRDPAERARYEAFFGLVARAASEADIAEAVALFAGSPQMRQRRLKAAFDDSRKAATEAGLTAEDVEQELAVWKRERSSQPLLRRFSAHSRKASCA